MEKNYRFLWKISCRDQCICWQIRS